MFPAMSDVGAAAGGGPPQVVGGRAGNDIPADRHLPVCSDGGHSCGSGGAGRLAASVMVILVEAKPGEVAVRRDGAGLVGGLDDDFGQSIEDLPLGGFVRFVGTRVAVADAEDGAAGDGKVRCYSMLSAPRPLGIQTLPQSPRTHRGRPPGWCCGPAVSAMAAGVPVVTTVLVMAATLLI